MKKRINLLSTLLVILLCASSAFSQVNFGIRGGLNFPSMKSDLSEFKTTFGVKAGIVMYTNLDNPFYFQTGLVYNGKGGSTTNLKETRDGQEAKFNYNNLEMPLNFGFQFQTGNSDLKIAPYGGFYGSYCMNGKVRINNGDPQGLFSGNETNLDYNRFDAGVNLGLNFNIANAWMITGQYQLGLANQLKDAGDNSLTHRAFSIGFDYIF